MVPPTTEIELKSLRADCGLVLNEVFSVAKNLATLQQLLFKAT